MLYFALCEPLGVALCGGETRLVCMLWLNMSCEFARARIVSTLIAGGSQRPLHPKVREFVTLIPGRPDHRAKLHETRKHTFVCTCWQGSSPATICAGVVSRARAAQLFAFCHPQAPPHTTKLRQHPIFYTNHPTNAWRSGQGACQARGGVGSNAVFFSNKR